MGAPGGVVQAERHRSGSRVASLRRMAAPQLGRLIVLTGVCAAGLSAMAGAASAQTTTTTTIPTNTVNNDPGLNLTKTGAVVFVGFSVGALLLLWLVPILMNVWSSSPPRYNERTTRKVIRMINRRNQKPNPLSAEDATALIAAVRSAPTSSAVATGGDQQSSVSQSLTQSLIALTVLSLIGFALAVLLLSSSTDAGELRKTILTSLLSILASISGFYFGARTAQQSAQQSAAQASGGAPTFSPPSPPPTVDERSRYVYTFSASGSPPPTYTLAGGPSWLKIDGNTGVVSGTAQVGEQSFSYSVVASNALGSASVGPFIVKVNQRTTEGT